jgi:hypothetical protein
MGVEGAPIEQVFRQVRVAVLEQTGGIQTPWDSSSMTRPYYFNPVEALSGEALAEKQMWESARYSQDMLQLTVFIKSYPDSQYGAEARALLGELINNTTSSIAKPVEDAAQMEVQEAETVEVTPTVVDDTRSQQEVLLKIARESGQIADYEAYLNAYPGGIYADLARFEMAVLMDQMAKEQDQDQPGTEPVPEILSSADSPVTYLSPIINGPDGVNGKTIEQAFLSSPLYAPFEGLPEIAWKDKSCSSCHQWERNAMCDQAKTYIDMDPDSLSGNEHPFGGAFRLHLSAWADNGCQ